MFRSRLFLLISIISIHVLIIHGRSVHRFQRQISSTRKPVSVKLCGLALVRILDMVCTRARQLLSKNSLKTTSQRKRQLDVQDDPYSHTVSFKDYARKYKHFYFASFEKIESINHQTRFPFEFQI